MPIPPRPKIEPNPYPFDPSVKVGRPAKYPFIKTQIGESFTVLKNGVRRSSLQQLCYRYGHDLGRRFVITDQPDKFKIECLASSIEIKVLSVAETQGASRLRVGESFEIKRTGAAPAIAVADRFSIAYDDTTYTITRTK